MSETLQHMLAAANAVIDTVSVHDGLGLLDDPEVVFVDIRDSSELANSGQIPGAIWASRGHLEFYADADSQLHKPEFSSGKRLVLYCASGGRSALAAKTLHDMGMQNVAHLAGGIQAWQEAGGPTAPVDN